LERLKGDEKLNDNQLRWYFFRNNMQELRTIMNKLRNQTGEIMIVSVWWLPSKTQTPIVFEPWFMDLRKGDAKDKRSNQRVNLRELMRR
jgi:hypothetical protein